MPSNKKKNKRTKREQRRARHNQNKKEGAVMTENIVGKTDSTAAETVVTEETKAEEMAAEEIIADGILEVAEDRDIADMADKTAEVSVADNNKTEVNTEKIEAETECPVREDNEVENKKTEDVTVTKGTIHKLYIQYNDLEFSDELMFEAAVNAYCNEYGQDKQSVEAVNLYVKPQEGKAYYVINNDAEKTGSIDL